MKTVNIIIFLLTTNFVFGQRSNTIFNTGTNEFQQFSRQDFVDNKLTKVSAYSYSINKKGKLTKDSLLLYKQQFDITQNRLFGLNSSRVYQSHGPSFLTWYEFETYYNDSGQVIKEISKPKNIEKKVEYGSTNYNIITDETDYEYDEQQKEVKRTYKRIDHYYSISKYTKDTFHLHTIYRPKIDEYFYNSDNQKIKWFHTVDSTKYLRTESYNPDKDSNSVRCSYCHSKYLNVEWKYNSDKKLVEWISYTSENLIHTKRNYFYDDQQRLIKQIDSAGWYFTTVKPYWESTTTFQYSDIGRIVTKINNTKERFVSSTPKIVSYFDTNDKLIKQCTFSDTVESCTQYIYVYDKNKIIKEEIIFDNGTISSTELSYNIKGLLSEERTFRNGNLTTLIRYYYE
ncbi:hypothetical protein [Chryseobacterium lacus]|uniref:hypothetical protein n=1 Tax=Chryseobacterium lacus TaxID=2058346 RepID=UPI000F88F697|nr:hypothetical protein [Chryseobacterium lacus]RST25389.1 hypothetical protein EIZ46_11365 [Chryseobacterium lacus]